MKAPARLLLTLGAALAAAPALTQSVGAETLNYSVNWPSGLSLGEARFQSQRAAGRWQYEFTLEAALPGFAVRDRYQSIAGEGGCSLELEKQFTHGQRKGHERTTFDAAQGVATRETLEGGGKSEITTPACPKDALTFLYYLRRELAQGRLPPAQTIYFGAAYQARVEYGGAQRVRVGDESVEADRLAVSVKGPASETRFELFFARDAARTLLVARAPFPLGLFSMELVR
jgi:hypothetical protein